MAIALRKFESQVDAKLEPVWKQATDAAAEAHFRAIYSTPANAAAPAADPQKKADEVVTAVIDCLVPVRVNTLARLHRQRSL
jgi:hypothetical protein